MKKAESEASRLTVDFGEAPAICSLPENRPPSLGLQVVKGLKGRRVIDMVIIEIWREFWQFTSLLMVWFQSADEPNDLLYRSVYTKFVNIVSLDFEGGAAVSAVFFSILCSIATATFSIFMYLCMKFESSEETKGLESVQRTPLTPWKESLLKWTLFILSTIYLPVARESFRILTCNPRYLSHHQGECFTAPRHICVSVVSVVMFAVLLIPFPMLLFKLIKSNRPRAYAKTESRKTRLSASEYRRELASDTCQLGVLYRSFEQDFSYLRVFIILAKFHIAAVTFLLVEGNAMNGQCTSGHQVTCVANFISLAIGALLQGALFAKACLYASSDYRYLRTRHAELDMILRASIAVLYFEFISATKIAYMTFVTDLTIHALLIKTIFSLLSLSILSLRPVRWLRRRYFLRKLDLTRSPTGPDYLLFDLHFSPKNERKPRIWQEFWQSVFLQDNELLSETPLKTPTMSKWKGVSTESLDVPTSVYERFRELDEIGEKLSVRQYASSLEAIFEVYNDPANRKLKTAVHHLLRDLHGPDVYWNGSANLEDGNRSTCFGTVFVSAFPLAAMFTPDDPEVDKTARFSLRMDVGVWNGHGVDDEHGIQLSTEEERQRIIDLVTLNADEEIVRRKRIRLMLRALENLPVQYLYECEKNKTIGLSRRVVVVKFTFTRGTFHIGRQRSRKASKDRIPTMWKDEFEGTTLISMAAGFDCFIDYEDGIGIDDEGKEWRGEKKRLYLCDAGILASDYEMNDKLSRFLAVNWAEHRVQCESRFIEIFEQRKRYRLHRLQQFQQRQDLLSFGFWYGIYNNDALTLEELCYLLSKERNPALVSFPQRHGKALKVLYQKLEFFDTHPTLSYWFCFWHDVWKINANLKSIRECELLLSPKFSESLVYHPMPTVRLWETLKDLDLIRTIDTNKSCASWRKTGPIDEALLSRFVQCMDRIAKEVDKDFHFENEAGAAEREDTVVSSKVYIGVRPRMLRADSLNLSYKIWAQFCHSVQGNDGFSLHGSTIDILKNAQELLSTPISLPSIEPDEVGGAITKTNGLTTKNTAEVELTRVEKKWNNRPQ